MDPARRQRILRQHLKTEQLLGLEAVPLAPRDTPQPGTPETTTQQLPAPESSASVTAAASREADQAASASRSETPAGFRQGPSETSEPMDRQTRIQALQQMDEQEVKGCTKCELCHGRTNTVFGEGDPEAPILFIGEGPGQSEDEQARPFVGRAGEMLTKMINAMGYDRQDLYIANIVKCRPPNNRTPAAIEVQTCWDYLRRQIEIIRPAAIVTLGGPSTKIILQTKQGITKIRGTWQQYAGIDPPIPVMPTFHPAFVLRAYTRDNRAKVWSDLQKVLEHIKAQ